VRVITQAHCTRFEPHTTNNNDGGFIHTLLKTQHGSCAIQPDYISSHFVSYFASSYPINLLFFFFFFFSFIFSFPFSLFFFFWTRYQRPANTLLVHCILQSSESDMTRIFNSALKTVHLSIHYIPQSSESYMTGMTQFITTTIFTGSHTDEYCSAGNQRPANTHTLHTSVTRQGYGQIHFNSIQLNSTPLHSTPLHSPPLHSTPLHSTQHNTTVYNAQVQHTCFTQVKVRLSHACALPQTTAKVHQVVKT